ncbi:MAG: tetratricopeptide repeat protein [Bacteroidota bacterium]
MFFISDGIQAQNGSDDRLAELEQSLDTVSNDTTKVLTLNNLAAAVMRTETEQALAYVQEGLKLSRQIDYKAGEGYHLRTLSNIMQLNDNYDSALFYQYEALDIFESLDRVIEVAGCYNNLAGTHMLLGQHVEALDLYIKAADILERQAYDQYTAIVQFNIANLYGTLQELDLALSWGKKALSYFKRHNDQVGLCDVHSLIGSVYLESNLHQLAFQELDSALTYCQATKDLYNQATIYHSLAEIYVQKNEIDSAQINYQKSLDLAASINDPSTIIQAQTSLAMIFRKKGLLAKANQYLDSALTVNDKIANNKYYKTIFEQKESLDSLRGDFAGALKYAQLQKAFQDSVYSEEKAQQMASLVWSYENKKKDQEIELLTKDIQINTLQSAKLQSSNYTFIASFILALVVLGLLVYNYRTKQLTYNIIRDQKSTLESTNIDKDQLIIEKDLLLKQRDILIKEAHYRVKNNLQFVSDILDAHRRKVKDHKLSFILNDTDNRIKSIAILHQNLYQNDNFVLVDTKKYFSDILNNLNTACSEGSDNINITTELETHRIPMTYAIPLGLIMNELVTNAYKHAFSQTSNGSISVRFRKPDETNFYVSVSDNGVGFPPDLDLQRATSMGLQLVNGLTAQLGADFKFQSDQNGTSYCVTFAIEDIES